MYNVDRGVYYYGAKWHCPICADELFPVFFGPETAFWRCLRCDKLFGFHIEEKLIRVLVTHQGEKEVVNNNGQP